MGEIGDVTLLTSTSLFTCFIRFVIHLLSSAQKKLKSASTNMSYKCQSYHCRYCGFKTTSSSGLSSHVSQSPVCLDKIVAANQPTSHPQKRPLSESPTPGIQARNDQPDEIPLYSSLLDDQPPRKRAHVDDHDDSVRIKMNLAFEDFDPPAGKTLQPDLVDTRSDFELLKEWQNSLGEQPWAPFSSVEDWDYARWIMESGLSQRQINSMLKLDFVSGYSSRPGFKHRGSPEVS